MKNIIVSILVIISFASCKKGGTYYCREYVMDGNVMYFTGPTQKKWFVSYNAMTNYCQNNSMWCDKK